MLCARGCSGTLSHALFQGCVVSGHLLAQGGVARVDFGAHGGAFCDLFLANGLKSRAQVRLADLGQFDIHGDLVNARQAGQFGRQQIGDINDALGVDGQC